MSSIFEELGAGLGEANAFVAKYLLGFALGTAAAPALSPFAQNLANDAWKLNQVRPIEALVAAAVAAEDVASFGDMQTQAAEQGIGADNFRALYGVALTAPGTGELLRMLRRGTVTGGNFTHGLRKARLEERWDEALAELATERLTPAQLALGIVRSVVPDPGLLAVSLDLSGGIVPAYPKWGGDVLAEAKAGGIDKDRLRVLVGEIGLPMSAQQAASAYFRGIIERGDFNRAILEGDTRPEWAPYILAQARQIPTAHDFIEKRLRGWADEAGMLAGVRRHGMSDADAETLFQITGRPLSFHQVFIGERRGGVYDGDTSAIDPAFLKSLRESNIRPEWYNLAWAQRYTYPSAFVLRALTQGGDLTADEAHAILLDIGWPPGLARTVADKWASTGPAKADPHVVKAGNQLWTALHKSYIAGESDAATVAPDFVALGIPADAHAEIIDLWNREAALVRRQLTPAQIKRAFTHSAVNEATGQPWTRDEALAALVALGYAPLAAGDYLNL